jgi:hypothetical protein
MASKFSYTVDDDTFCVRIYSEDQTPPVSLTAELPEQHAV